jgi:hypothetical protein
MKNSTASLAGLDPLKDLLSDVLSRLEALESTVGKGVSPPRGTSSRALGSISQHSSSQPGKSGTSGK